jgi:hypothetical protein
MTRKLDPLPPRQVAINRLPELIDALLEPVNFSRKINLLVRRIELTHFCELRLKIYKRLLEIK